MIEIVDNEANPKELSKLTKEEWREYTKTVWHIANVSHTAHPAVFPEEIPKRLIKMFSFHGETVLDPFAGTGTTGYVAVQHGRKAICVEQNEAYTQLIRDRFSNLTGQYLVEEVLQVVNGDSRDLSFLGTNSVGLVVTSPPYWNKANYGEGESNLGRAAQYRNFLDQIKPVFEEASRVLIPGRKLCVVTANVNQYTDHGLLTFPLASDIIIMLRNLGLVMVTEIIWSKDGTGGKWGSSGEQRPIFGSYPYPPNFLFKNVHEYVIVFAKPPAKLNAAAKCMPYHWLMQDDYVG